MKYKMLPVVMLAVFAVALVMVSPVSDATCCYFVASADSGSGTEDDPYSGDVLFDGKKTSSTVLLNALYYVEEGSTVTIDCSSFKKVTVKDTSENFVTPDTYSDDDAVFSYTVEDPVVYTAVFRCFTAFSTYNDYTIYVVSVNADSGVSAIESDEAEALTEEASTSTNYTEGYSYWLAVIIIAVIVVALLWLIKKVR